MRKLLFTGIGINKKTGKPIAFEVPQCITKRGIKCLAENILTIETSPIDLQALQEKFPGLKLSDNDRILGGHTGLLEMEIATLRCFGPEGDSWDSAYAVFWEKKNPER